MSTGNMYSQLIDVLSFVTLAITFSVICSRRLRNVFILLSLQAILLSGITGLVAFVSNIKHIYFAAAITLFVKGFLVPAVLLYTLRKISVINRVESFFSTRLNIVIAIILMIISFYVTEPDLLSQNPLARNSLPIAISLVLLGLFIMISRKKALMQVVGIITMENGLYLMTVSTTYGMPLLVELGMFFDLLVGVIIMGILAYRINKTFDTINTAKLNNLKG